MPQYVVRSRRKTWNESHHVVRSRGNDLAPKGQRTYFDHLPNLRRRPEDVLAALALPRRPGSSALRPRSPSPARAASARSRLSTGLRMADAPSIDLLTSAASTPLPGCVRLSLGRRSPPAAASTGPLCEPGSPRQAWSPTGAHGGPSSPSGGSKERAVSSMPTGGSSTPSGGRNSRGGSKERPGPNRKKFARLLSEQERAGSGHHHPAYLHLAEWAEAKGSHMVALWRRLDSNASGFLHKMELVHGLKEMNFPGKLEELWECMDVDKRGTIAFFEFAPRSARILASFKHWIYQTFGSCAKFFKAMDTDHNHKLALHEWKHGLEQLNLPEDLHHSAEVIFRMLDCCDENYLHRNAVSEDELAFLDQWHCPPYFQGQADAAAQHAFHNALIGRCRGNSILAWRSIDIDKNMVLSWDDFQAACKDLAKAGVPGADKVVEVYLCYDPEKTGMFSLRSWDPEAFRLLASFTVLARSKSGRPSTFVRSLGNNVDGGVSMDAFDAATEELALSNKDLETLFSGLAGFDERLYWRDATFLDQWDLDAQGRPPELGRAEGGHLESADEASLKESHARAQRREQRGTTVDFGKKLSFGS